MAENGILGTENNDVLIGTSGDDYMHGYDGDDRLYGGEGNDDIIGGAGDDYLDGGAGNDFLSGGQGSDTYVFGRGYGHDQVRDVASMDGSSTTAGDSNVIILKDLNWDDVRFEAVAGSNDLRIRIKDTGETMTVVYGLHWNTANHMSSIKFADGSSMSTLEICAAGLYASDNDQPVGLQFQSTLYGTDGNDNIGGSNYDDVLYGGSGDDYIHGGNGNDTIYGGDGVDDLHGGDGDDVIYGGDGDDKLTGGLGDDVLDGGAGNDTLYGGVGSDVFVFGRGYGHDTVINMHTNRPEDGDIIRLAGLTKDDLVFEQPTATDFRIRIKDTGETITVINGLHSNAPYRIQAVEFGDGSRLTLGEILYNEGIQGTSENDRMMVGVAGGTKYFAGDGDDWITGSSYDDILYGEAGNDTLNGGAGNDILDGGAGNDSLTGGTGDDIFVFGRGYGHDSVQMGESRANNGFDLIRLLGLSRDDVIFEQSNASDFRIRIKDTGETITVVNGLHANAEYRLEAVEFADGNRLTMAEILYGEGLHGSPGNGVVSVGGAGPTKFFAGDGNDRVTGGVFDDILYGGRWRRHSQWRRRRRYSLWRRRE